MVRLAMTRTLRIKGMALLVGLATLAPLLQAADYIPVGTWVRRPTTDRVIATMLVESAGTSQKFTFKLTAHGGGITTMVFTSQFDGKDAVVMVNGKPSGETMAIRKVDDHHIVNVIKMNGNPMLTQKSEISADGKTIKVEGTSMVAGAPAPAVEYWDKK